jgi:hypothetical protein
VHLIDDGTINSQFVPNHHGIAFGKCADRQVLGAPGSLDGPYDILAGSLSLDQAIVRILRIGREQAKGRHLIPQE